MTLIISPYNSTNRTGVKKWKSEFWEKQSFTPNEAVQCDREYRRMIRDFAGWNGIQAPYRFFEARIVSSVTSALYRQNTKWWEHREFMDHVFWVFQKPIVEDVDGVPYTYWCLEPFECQRVWRTMIDRLNQQVPPGQVFRAGLAVPCECMDLAWKETVNGRSEHIHERAPYERTQEQVDAEAIRGQIVEDILSESMDLDSAGMAKVDAGKVTEISKRVR